MIAGNAKRSDVVILDCRVACAPRNDGARDGGVTIANPPPCGEGDTAKPCGVGVVRPQPNSESVTASLTINHAATPTPNPSPQGGGGLHASRSHNLRHCPH